MISLGSDSISNMPFLKRQWPTTVTLNERWNLFNRFHKIALQETLETFKIFLPTFLKYVQKRVSHN
jgi:hypothetical protein